MKIYVAHSTGIDFEAEVYGPVRRALADRCQLILPHENNKLGEFSLPLIRKSDGVVAFINHPSEGRLLEVGWATALGVPVVLVTKEGEKYNKVYRFLLRDDLNVKLIEYSNVEDLVKKLQTALNENKKGSFDLWRFSPRSRRGNCGKWKFF